MVILRERLVAGGHTTETPDSSTYLSVVSSESVHVAFLLAVLNNFELFVADVGNAYLNAPCHEKIWCRAGKEFESDEGCVMIIVQALYGLKTSGVAWRVAFAEKLTEMGYKSTKADPDVWIQQAVKPNGLRYYRFCLSMWMTFYVSAISPRRQWTKLSSFIILRMTLLGHLQGVWVPMLGDFNSRVD